MGRPVDGGPPLGCNRAATTVLTEMGGWPHGGGSKVGIIVGEKGIAWRRLQVSGTPGHGSMPFGADNAIVKAAEVVRRLASLSTEGPARRDVGSPG